MIQLKRYIITIIITLHCQALRRIVRPYSKACFAYRSDTFVRIIYQQRYFLKISVTWLGIATKT